MTWKNFTIEEKFVLLNLEREPTKQTTWTFLKGIVKASSTQFHYMSPFGANKTILQ